MKKRVIYWLDWKTKQIYLNKKEFCPWSEVEKIKQTIYFSHWDWIPLILEEKEKKIIADQEQRIIKIGNGQTVLKEVYNGSLEKPHGEGRASLDLLNKLVPEFTSVHPSSSKKFIEKVKKWKWGQRWETWNDAALAWSVDYRRCFASIMRNYALPCGEPKYFRGSQLIQQKLKLRKKGFVKFYLKGYAKIKKKQIPFIPDYEPVIKKHKSLLLYTRLFKAFLKQYKIVGEINYSEFWEMEEKKGCANIFLDYCQVQEKKAKSEEEKKEWKNKPNALWGILGQRNFGGYTYFPWHLAVIQTSLLLNYHLYRKFKPKNVLAIRADAVVVNQKPPEEIANLEIYQIKRIGLKGKETFDYDAEKLKSPLSGSAREKSLKEWLEIKKHLKNKAN